MPSTRRSFLQSTAALTAASQARILGANDRIRLAGLGTGGRCRYILENALKIGGCDLVAVCDVNAPRRAGARAKLAPQAQEFLDYRDVLARNDIDAVVIGSPDHWHVPMSIDAVRAGKDVYVEKPVSHTIEEGALLIQAVEQSGRILQVGYQQRSWDHFQLAHDLVRSGRLGQVTLVESHWYQDYIRNFGKLSSVSPADVDWKRFLGNAKDQPFDERRLQQWRWYWDFGGGAVTDLHSHWGDVVHWYMQQDRPLSAAASGSKLYHKYWDCPDTLIAAWQYPNYQLSFNSTLIGHLEGGTLVFRGTNGMLRITRDGFALYPEGVLAAEKTNYPEPLIAVRSTGDGTPAHVRNFLDCVRSRKAPNAGVRSSVASANAAHLANLAYRNGGAARAA
ncbi:MAG: Gfo/Idh/MocA family oxidoreductase [Acidobacteria bacterium]|nr:Gfo/Idh/MocA family oxidoreductase [Acidobacteriota bacterium]